MIATTTPCLTDDQLRDLASGRLPGDRFGCLMEHLDVCSECQQRADHVDASDDSLMAALGSPSDPDPHAAESACVAALHACSKSFDQSAPTCTPPIEQLGVYRLIRPLGRGGMGAVYLARHVRLRRQCAIKLLPRDRGSDAAWRERFDREMAAVAALDDPHVVAASDAGEAGGWHFLVMEYLDGLDLSRLAGRMGPLEIADACELVRQAAVGLAHVHAAGLVHRDIKPSNLMLTRDGVVKILDLGLVLSDHDPLPADDRLTTVGQLMGTLAYMAPEQLADSTTVDHRADLYSLGATLFRLLAGTPPHGSAGGIAPLVIAKTHEPVPDLGQARGVQTRDGHALTEIPPSLNELVHGLLNRDPLRRPQSATDVAEALQPHTLGSDPKRLIAEARRKRPSSEESNSIAPVPLPLAERPGPPRSWNWKRVVAAASLPLFLLAGIILVIATDRGQLVIESEMSGLDVSVHQGEEIVEQLELSTGENRVTLRSGTYTVAIDAEADGLRLSDETATVTRGGESVLSVRREPRSSLTAFDRPDAGPRFRGETFGHWLTVLETEHDVETVIDAMKAVVALSTEDGFGDESIDREARSTDDESKRVATAASMLRAARRFGGFQSSNPGNMTAGLKSPSAQFMGNLLALYPAMLPNPGLAAISQELEVGNEKSRFAAVWMLSNYTGQVYEEPYRPEFGELERWSRTDEGRERLRKLSERIDRAVEALGGYAFALSQDVHRGQLGTLNSRERESSQAIERAYQQRLEINELLEVDSWRDPTISDRLQRSVEAARQTTLTWFASIEKQGGVEADFGGPQRLSKPEVTAAINALDAEAAAWAVVPSLLESYREGPEAARLVLKQLGNAAPTATADAMLSLIVARGFYFHLGGMGGGMVIEMGGIGGGMGGGLSGIPIYSENEKLWSLAIEFVGRSTTQPRAALGLLQMKWNERRPYEQLPLSDFEVTVEAVIKQLESRVNSEPAP